MKILVFDIGGTAIKYGICQDGHLMETSHFDISPYIIASRLSFVSLSAQVIF